MITKLTRDQEVDLSATLTEWLAIGSSGQPLDRPRCTRAIDALYAAAGEAPSPQVLYFSSPLMCILAWGALKFLAQRLKGTEGKQLRGQLWGQLRGQLEGQLRGQLEGQLEGQLGGQLEGQLGNYFAGAHWCAWEVFYDFCRRIGVQYNEWQNKTLDLWLEQSKACHWWFPYKGLVLASERHADPHFDEQRRLHNDKGAAISYSDGYGVWAIHGVRVPAHVVEEPSKLTIREMETESNSEVRRIMIERFGQERFIKESGAKKVHTDDWGTLWRKELRDDEPLVMVEVLNSTAEPDGTFKTYFLRVPPNITRAREAIAWTFDKPESEYEPALQT